MYVPSNYKKQRKNYNLIPVYRSPRVSANLLLNGLRLLSRGAAAGGGSTLRLLASGDRER